MQWRPSVSNIADSGWRLTLPASRVQDASLVHAMLPEVDGRWTKQVFNLFANLPKPRTHRLGQQAMGYAAALSIERNMVLLANAGVGIGKTYAYLIPILLRMKRNPNTTAVVSTGTILLQHQLMGDIADAQKIVGSDVPVRVIKGQNQYLCMRKLQELDVTSTPLPDSLSTLRSEWADQHEALVIGRIQQLRKITRTVHGKGGYFGDDRQERVYSDRAAEGEARRVVSGPDFGEDKIDRHNFEDANETIWQSIRVDEESPCRECSWRRSCGFYRMRTERQQFQGILVVNHGLLAHDLYSRLTEKADRGGGLWPLPFVTVVDEAHSFEGFLRQEAALAIRPGNVRHELAFAAQTILSADLKHGLDVARSFADAANDLSEALYDSIRQSEHQRRLHTDSEEMGTQRFYPVDYLAETLDKVLGDAEQIQDLLILAQSGGGHEDLAAVLAPLRRLLAWLRDGKHSEYVTWLEKRTIFIGDLNLVPLTEVLARRATILASGTLGIGDDFALIERTLGLDEIPNMQDRLLRLYAPSPFDYRRKMSYVLATDMPHPTKPEAQEDRVQTLADAIRRTVVQHYRVLALFTRRRQLMAVSELLQGIPDVLVEGDASPDKLAERFRRLQFGIYLSTSAWEGLDAPGTGAVVIAQLPYPVPEDPWVDAKCRIAEARGYDPFLTVITPIMQMRLLQGVGRLIRRDEDEGKVYILDPRSAEDKRFNTVLKPVLPAAKAQRLPVLSTSARLD